MKTLLAILGFWAGAWAGVTVRDTVVFGIPSVRIMAGTTHQGELKIDTERGQLRASLEGKTDSVLVVFDRNPFARMAGRTRPLTFPPRVTKSRLVLPKAAAEDILKRLQVSPGVDSATQAANSVPVAPTTPKSDSAIPAAPAAVAPTSEVQPQPVAAAAPTEDPDPVLSPAKSDGHDFTIVIDAGHGGKDPGAMGKNGEKAVYEKDATLAVAKKLRDALQKRKGVKVVMTRDTDVFLKLSERTQKANAAKGELFISLHCNSLPLTSKRREEVNGFIVFLLREAKDEADKAIERRENEAIQFETGERQKKDALTPVEWMLLEHQLNQYTKESERFAGEVVRQMEKDGVVAKERTGAGQAGFFVLVGSMMPSVLIEMGYLSSSSDVQILSDPDRQKKIAESIAKSVDSFLAKRR
ncbi:MAG: N-acetylmuramoyl-L-alanine amidase [Fibrobacteres bacterium]|nr:N-acetylmuramoyl-L-alanine amidase [Fibrobacterota bacterium]